MKLLPYIVFKKHINILALEMTSPGNRHCDNCINALSFPIMVVVMVDVRISYGWGEASTDKKNEKKRCGCPCRIHSQPRCDTARNRVGTVIGSIGVARTFDWGGVL